MTDDVHDDGYRDFGTQWNAEMVKTIAEVRSQSSDVGDLMDALAKAQGQIEDMERDRTVTVQPRSGAAYKFRYATLGALIRGIKKALSDNGIARTQVLTFETNDRLYYLTTSLHYKNQFISSVTPLIIGDIAGNQQFGSALTYMKRYALAALVGVAADEDDDGNLADGNEVKAFAEALRSGKEVAPDPIVKAAAAPTRVVSAAQSSVPSPSEEMETPAPVIEKIEVEALPDGSDNDWMKWGRAFMDAARSLTSTYQLAELEKLNQIPLSNMQEDAPKMYTNLMTALIKRRNDLEKKSK